VHSAALRRPLGCTHRYLYGNQLNGTLPSSLGSLTALQYLCVCAEGCCLHCMVLRRCAVCARSALYNNQLSGSIPSSLGSLTALQYLCVRRSCCCLRCMVLRRCAVSMCPQLSLQQPAQWRHPIEPGQPDGITVSVRAPNVVMCTAAYQVLRRPSLDVCAQPAQQQRSVRRRADGASAGRWRPARVCRQHHAGLLVHAAGCNMQRFGRLVQRHQRCWMARQHRLGVCKCRNKHRLLHI
jgi:hypothetical protein